MTHRRLQVVFFSALFLGILALSFFIFLPYLGTLALAAVFAVLLQPIYRRLHRLLAGQEHIASLLTVLLTIIVIVTPLTFIGFQILEESKDLYGAISSNREVYIQRVSDVIQNTVRSFVPGFSLDVNQGIRYVSEWLINNLTAIFSGTITVILQIFLGFIALYYFLKDGRQFLKSFVALSPLDDVYDEEIFSRLERAINSVLKGSLFVALIQGFLTGIGFTLFGIPNAMFWGSIAAVSALIPGIGTSLILIPGIIYLFASGQTSGGVGLLLWGAVAVGLIDNFLGPILVGRGAQIHPFFILFSVLGGVSLFGPIGFIFGPLIVSLLYALMDIYRLLVKEEPISPKKVKSGKSG